MGRQKNGKGGGKQQRKTNKNKNVVVDSSSSNSEDRIWVDPARIRYQHSRIRPFFSGCGRSVEETLDALRQGKLQPSDIPPIQVIVGPDDGEGPWYFSLNNRRLWVFKRLREEGLLPNNQISVRVRAPKSEAERARYCLENCAVEAKLMREAPSNKAEKGTTEPNRPTNDVESPSKEESSKAESVDNERVDKLYNRLSAIGVASDEDDDDESLSDDEMPGQSNSFSVLG